MMAEHVVAPPATRLESGRPVRVWYGIAAGPGAWVLLGTLDWFITGRACVDGDPSWGALSAGGVRALLAGVGVLALAATLVALAGSARAWRELSGPTSLTTAYGYGVAEYLAIAGVVISGVFLLAIVWTALPAVMVDICQGAR